MTSNQTDLLAAYDDQLRAGAEAGSRPSSTDGPVVRIEFPRRGLVSYRTLDGLRRFRGLCVTTDC